MDFLRRYAMLIDGLPTVLLGAVVAGGAPAVPLLETCQHVVHHLTTLDNKDADDAAAAAAAAAAAGTNASDGGGSRAGGSKIVPSIGEGYVAPGSAPTDNPTWHISPAGVYLRTHHQWVRLENYRAHRAHSLVTRIQGAYRRHLARRILLVISHPHPHTLFQSNIIFFLSFQPNYTYLYFISNFTYSLSQHLIAP